MNPRGHTAKYAPPPETRRAAVHPHLCLVSPKPSQGVGAEATRAALLFEDLAARMNVTETLTHALLERIERPEQESAPIDYEHLEGKLVRRMKVRYRNLGRLPPREVPIDDIDE